MVMDDEAPMDSSMPHHTTTTTMMPHHTTMMPHHTTTMNHGGMGMGGMNMVFTTDYNLKVLFDFWEVNNVGTLIASIFITIFLGVFYEFIKFVSLSLTKKQRLRLLHQRRKYLSSPESHMIDSGAHLIESTPQSGAMVQLVLQSLIHGLQMLVGYLLMLIAMTYQVYLFLSVIVGVIIGHGICFYLFELSGLKNPSIVEHGELSVNNNSNNNNPNAGISKAFDGSSERQEMLNIEAAHVGGCCD